MSGLLPLRSILAVLAFSTLAACGPLPRGAALQMDVLKSAGEGESEIAVYPITRGFLPVVAGWETGRRGAPAWIGRRGGSKAQIIRPGDTLDAHVWDTGENSLLSSPEQRSTHLPALRVSETGMIFVPYVGRVKVSGQTPEAARAVVQRKLEEVVPSVQVQLTMAEGRNNTVDLVTGVQNPGSIPLPDQNFTVLSAISAGGGVRADLVHPQVKLLRGHQTYAIALQELFDHGARDTRLRGGDKLLVEEDPRYFIALGAAGQEAQIGFNRAQVTALDALALMGGLKDNRADPRGVLILREYPEGSVTPGQAGPDNTRVVFTLDLTTSDGLFSARSFLIETGDLVLATESPVSDTRTVLGLAGAAFGLVVSANAAGN